MSSATISRRRKSTTAAVSSSSSSASQKQARPEEVVEHQVPSNRPEEIERYLRLFGYKPESTILQVHVAGSFGRHTPTRRDLESRKTAVSRYEGHTFTVVGRSHDPNFIQHLVKPKKGHDTNPGYLGYLFAGKDEDRKPPHALLPLDFVPNGMVYPGEWKSKFNTPGYLITMHVPSDFARHKNELTRRLRRIGGAMDARKEWTFFDELQEFGYPSVRSTRKSEEEEEEEAEAQDR